MRDPLPAPAPLLRRCRPPSIAVSVVLAAALVATACGDGDGDGDGDGAARRPTSVPSIPADPPTEAGDPDDATASPPVALEDVEVRMVDLELGLESTIAAAAVPDSRSVIVAERPGRLHEVVLDDRTATLVDGPLLDLVERVGTLESERGLLGVAVAPDGSYLVASYTRAADGASVIDRYELSGTPGALSADPATRTELLTAGQPHPNHNGGHVTFGPDGFLYVGLGDGGARGDPEGNGQDRGTLLGKILRIDASGGEPVPPDNPFVDVDGARPEIWSTGVRNPWRFAFDRETGDLWVADVGQDSLEEIDYLPASEGAGKGANLGWDLFEGTEEFRDPDPADGDASAGPFVSPIHTYGRDRGCSISGGVVYRGEAVPGLDGAFLFGDYCEPGVRALGFREGQVVSVDLGRTLLDGVVGFAEAPDGEVLVLSLRRGVHLLVAG